MGRKRKRRGQARTPYFVGADSLLDATPVATLDLHGQTVSQAEVAVANFLETSWRRAPGAVVHIITGRGAGSVGPPVLRRAVARLLRTRFQNRVQEFDLDLDEGGYMVRLTV